MERKDFLKKVGMTTMLLPLLDACGKSDPQPVAPSCSVTDTETDGPYPLYTSRGSSIERVDITDGKTGVPLKMTLTVKNVSDNCNLIDGARVDIWHCDKDGYYSGYANSGYLGTQNNSALVFCRGLQYTKADGIVKFTTIYPGWYTGRATHIHLQVYLNLDLKLTTQIAFPDTINTDVYGTALYKTHGQNPTKNTGDSIIKDSLPDALATLTANATTGGYDLTYTLYVEP